MKPVIAVLAVILAATSAAADVKLPPVIGDHMVLQRDRAVPIWGWADPGEKVTVKIAGQSHSAVADGDGHWTVKLEPMRATRDSLVMTLTASNFIILDDILVGEVWVCSGQSNMAMSVDRATDEGMDPAQRQRAGRGFALWDVVALCRRITELADEACGEKSLRHP